jgi:hypothetical protein
MTVSDLISQLQKLDGNMIVVVNGKHEWNRHNFVKAEKVVPLKVTLDDNIFYEDDGEADTIVTVVNIT